MILSDQLERQIELLVHVAYAEEEIDAMRPAQRTPPPPRPIPPQSYVENYSLVAPENMSTIALLVGVVGALSIMFWALTMPLR